jgi:hypothetical protein
MAPDPKNAGSRNGSAIRPKYPRLGGMDERRFERVRPLGFVGWAGITAWKRGKIRT